MVTFGPEYPSIAQLAFNGSDFDRLVLTDIDRTEWRRIAEETKGRLTDDALHAAVSRLRPVVLAAATTVLGVMPLLPDVFWVAMAVTIMFGLAFGTVLTMVLLPVLYACLYGAT